MNILYKKQTLQKHLHKTEEATKKSWLSMWTKALLREHQIF